MRRECDEYEIFSIVSSAGAWACIILAGKRGSRGHSTTTFNESVVAAGTSFSILQSGEVLTPGGLNLLQ